jgi:GDPmannose 4,6-dehydratase
MTKRAVIFGGGGQDGVFLYNLLVSLGHVVRTFTHSGGEIGPALDVSEFNSVEMIIREYRPDLVFHLAARSSTRHEFILENHRAIVDGALAVMESVDRHIPNSKVFLASSALIFKNNGVRITEDDELTNDTAYAMARVEALQIARYYRHRGRKVYVGFLFNHESPLRPPTCVARQIATNVVKIHRGLTNCLSIGNSNVIKEWTWAGDIVQAIVCLMNQKEIFEVCIGDGIGKTIKDYALACCEVLNISLSEFLAETPDYKVEYSILVNGSSKMRSLGWVPQVDINNLAKRMIKHEAGLYLNADLGHKK